MNFKIYFSLLLLLSIANSSAFVLKAKTLFVDYNIYKKRWIDIAEDKNTSLKEVIKILAKSTTGQQLITKAQKKAGKLNHSLLEIITPALGSLTDTTLIRKFSISDPSDVRFEIKSHILLNKNLPIIEAVLDLAHELTHFNEREAFNPYDDDFSLTGFVKSMVEGEGGEVDAFISECQVLYQLFTQEKMNRFNCQKIGRSEGGGSRSSTTHQFYQMGAFFKNFVKEAQQLGANRHLFPQISGAKALFFSSAYGVPYPLAAVREYKTIVTKVCHNDLRRLKIYEQKNSPAQYQFFLRSYQNRCTGPKELVYVD